MAVPSYLATDFDYSFLRVVTDVQEIIDEIIAMIIGFDSTPTEAFPNGQQWTLVSGTTYKSPVDAGGRFMTVVFTRTSATRMRWTVADPVGTVWDGSIDASGTGPAEIFAGPGHLICWSLNAAVWEAARAIMADPTPEPLASTTVYVYSATYRTVAGGVCAGTPTVWTAINYRFTGGLLTSPALNVVNAGGLAAPQMPAQDTANTHLLTQAGSNIGVPLCPAVQSASGADNLQNGGKFYQILCVDSSFGAGAEIAIPIDLGVTGKFKVQRMVVSGARQFAIRVA